ncbi:TetR/AcrR family transcriptional regulator [Streptomyces sp. N2-109]|uniref:TetR/AcrR family transcriptional regulator n=1 Tax=Streptomyces gossypii TaxID=2883101 RepID=A0ABT2JPW2_9ACTN|nr:helix-turn-helix domain-containing protein [Streptomyces gossypii]MCT2589564.1 TetR/AcrR family transcriptional regulator [Streptomyces gossypii]
MHIQGIQDSTRSTPLRVDAQRNLEHVLRAAREVFGELGYGAPMEDVARRARVGVGTVYRRFPSKDVLVRRIAEEETARLTEQAKAALGQEEQPWAALSRFLRTSVASGAGRLLPPRILRTEAPDEEAAAEATTPTPTAPFNGTAHGVEIEGLDTEMRVPQQRQVARERQPGLVLVESHTVAEIEQTSRPDELRPGSADPGADASGETELLEVVGQLVERARAAGELRASVTVGDVLLVIATAAPMLPDPDQQAAASARLLDILLEGLRSRPTL